MSMVFRLVSPQIASRNPHLHYNLSCHMVRYLLQISRISAGIPNIPMMHKVQLTGDKDWQVNERSVPGYDEEYLGYTPLALPNMLDFTIKGCQPIIHLVIGDCPGQMNCEWLSESRLRHQGCKGLTKTVRAAT